MNATIKIQNCQGYLWNSDATEPQVFVDCPCELQLDDGANPFVLEAMLYDVGQERSYMVKYVDGRHLLHEYDLRAPSEGATDFDVLPNRMPGVAALKLRQFWRPVPDQFCNGYEVLTPAGLAFAGFKKEGE